MVMIEVASRSLEFWTEATLSSTSKRHILIDGLVVIPDDTLQTFLLAAAHFVGPICKQHMTCLIQKPHDWTNAAQPSAPSIMK